MRKGSFLTWVGCSGFLALGIFLLPVPVRSQEPKKKVIIFQFEGKPGLILIKDRSPDQEIIELLQKALKILAKKSQAPAGVKADEIKKARDQVDVLRRQKELVEAKLRQAQARLSQLEGKPGAGIPLQFKWELLSPKKAPAPKVKGTGIPQELELKFQDGKIIGLIGKKDRRVQADELKSRLDRLLREVEELRRDIQRAGPAKK